MKLTLALLLTFPMLSCSSPVDPQENLRLGQEKALEQDWPAAYEAYGQAILDLGEAGSDTEVAKRGQIKSLCGIKPLDALELGRAHLETFVGRNGEEAGPDLVGGIAGDFREVGSLDAAALFTAIGLKRYPANAGLHNLESRINKETWQAMQEDLASVGYLRQSNEEILDRFGLRDEYDGDYTGDHSTFLLLVQPVTYKWITEQGYYE